MPLPTRAALRRRPKDDRVLGLAFILPAGIGLVAFYIWPLVRGVWLSFTEYNLLTPATFTGVDNYKRMLNDSVFWNAVKVTLEYVIINIGVQTAVALLIVVLMQRLTRSTFMRAIVLTPYLVSNVVVAMLWLWILDNILGIDHPGADGGERQFLQLSPGHPHDCADQRVEAHGLHRPSHLRRSPGDPEHCLRGGQGRRRQPVDHVLEDHDAAAASDPDARPHHDDNRLLPGLRHRLGDHPGRSRQRDPRPAVLHLRHGLQSFPVRLRLGHGRRTAQGRPTPRPAGGRASAESSPGS